MSDTNQNLIVDVKKIISKYEYKAKILFDCIEKQSVEDNKLNINDHDFSEKHISATVIRTILVIKRRIYTEISLELASLRAILHDDNN